MTGSSSFASTARDSKALDTKLPGNNAPTVKPTPPYVIAEDPFKDVKLLALSTLSTLIPHGLDRSLARVRELTPIPDFTNDDSFAVTSSAALDQAAFAQAYVSGLGRIVSEAKKYLLQARSIDRLEDLREELQAAGGLSSPIGHATGVRRQEVRQIQELYESSVRTELAELSSRGTEDRALSYRALCLAILLCRHAELQTQIETALRSPVRDTLIDFAKMRAEAISRCDGTPTASGVMVEFVKLAKERGYPAPKLVVIQDFDGNLTRIRESGSEWKPGAITNQLVAQIEAIADLSPLSRLVMAESAGLDHDRRLLSQQLYEIAAQNCAFFDDVPALFRLLDGAGARHSILSTNHGSVIEAKLRQSGLNRPDILAPSESFVFTSKRDALLSQVLTDLAEGECNFYIFSEDNDSDIVSHLQDPASNPLHALIPEIKLQDLFLLSSREGTGYPCRVAESMKRQGLVGILNRQVEDSAGVGQLIALVREFDTRYGSIAVHTKDWSPRITEPYRTGDVSQQCRGILSLSPTFPQPFETATVLRPIHDPQLIGTAQYDIGVPTAHYVGGDKWLLLYKAATAPSGHRGKDHPNPSFIYGATYDAGSNVVEYFDSEKRLGSALGLNPLLTSVLGPTLARDGLHDPRLTVIPELNKGLLLACAFNKHEEQSSIKAARGDISRPIRGAVTELFVSDTPSDPLSYRSVGQFGPDFHFKNMVFFPGVFQVDGDKCLLVLARKLPGIQTFPIPLSALNSEVWSTQRDEFWARTLSPESIVENTIFNPSLTHEGFGNPCAPGRVGQIAPGGAPIKVEYMEASGRMVNAWLLIYNCVPDFYSNEVGSPYGRVISAALLNFERPWEVLARSPHPIVAPRTRNEIEISDGISTRHEDIAFTGGSGIDEHGRLMLFFTENDSLVRVAKWSNVSRLVQWISRFGPDGKPRPERR